MLLCGVSNTKQAAEVLFCHLKLSVLGVFTPSGYSSTLFAAVLCKLYLEKKPKDIIPLKKRLFMWMLFMQLLNNDALNCL